MTPKKHIKRIFSFVLAIVLLISAIPISLAVQNLLAEETASKIVREVTELREESVKHFLCEDGSYIAAVYPNPVHYQENGEWKEIDNSLALDLTTLSESGKPTYTTKAGDLSVSIPQNFSDGQRITAQKNGYEISFGINSEQKDVSLITSASVVEPELLSSNTEVAIAATDQNDYAVTLTATDSTDTEVYNAEIMTVENQSGAVAFKEIMPDTDLEYIVSSGSIKENIVVYEPQSEYTYSFDMDFDGLTPVVNPDNSVSLTEPDNPDETVFFIEAPYMYDADSEESIDIEMSLVSNGDEYVMTLIASAEWINAEERVFPVVIDPTINILGSDLNDVFVIDGLYANSPRINSELRVGRNLTNVARTYIKPELPTNIPLGSVVDSAVLSLYKASYYQAPSADDISVYAYDCCNVAAWEPDEISWNNQPYNNSDNGYQSTSGAVYLSQKSAAASTMIYSFNIKDAVQRWVNGGVNNGLLLASSDESTKTQIDLVSSRASDSSYLPNVFVEYEVPRTSRTAWTTGEEADSCTIAVTAALDWTATSNQSWLTVTNIYDYAFTIAVSENTGAQERTGTITVTMGDNVISTIDVVQFGAASTLLIDKTSWNAYGKSDSMEVTITSNDNWNIIIDDDWVTASPLEGEGNAVVAFEVSDNTSEKRNATVTIVNEAGDIEREFNITQLDVASSYFCEFDSNGNIASIDSSQYNHALATWAMKLSYAAYNYPDGTELPYIPGAFMNGLEDTVADVLRSLGFPEDNIIENNYTEEDCGAYTIAYRNIEFAVTENTNYTDERTEENDNIAVYKTDIPGALHAGLYNMGSDTGSSQLTGSSRPLVVVAVRGSVTNDDWDNNFKTQFVPWDNKFAEMKDTIADNLESYISELSNPIILVTGHSLGAAIANLLAADLSQTMGIQNVYAYTFGTPNVLTEALEPDAVPYTNIFNILNTNDVVTYVPFTFWFPVINFWSRHGIDIPLNMPYDDCIPTVPVGLFSHSMAVYMAWMEAHENITYSEIMEESAQARTRGLLPWIVRIKCPVNASVKDSDGRLIAYEGQEDNLFTQSAVTDTGIVSWIDDDGAKMFFIPAGANAESIEIDATNYGTMDIAIGTAGTTNESEIKVFNDVLLYPEKEFTVEISDDILPENSRLFVTDDGEVIGEVTDTDPFFKGVTVEQSDVAYGEPVTFTLVTDNTVTAMMLHGVHMGDQVNLVPGEGDFSVTPSGENELTWTVTHYTDMPYSGQNAYDISVQSGGVWYYYENVIALNYTES